MRAWQLRYLVPQVARTPSPGGGLTAGRGGARDGRLRQRDSAAALSEARPRSKSLATALSKKSRPASAITGLRRPDIVQTTRWPAAGLLELEGRQVVRLEGLEEPQVDRHPRRGGLQDLHLALACLLVAGPVVARARLPRRGRSRSGRGRGSRPSHGDHCCHAWKSSTRAWTRSAGASTVVERAIEKSATASLPQSSESRRGTEHHVRAGPCGSPARSRRSSGRGPDATVAAAEVEAGAARGRRRTSRRA